MGIQQENLCVADMILENLVFFCTSLQPDNRRLRGIKSGLLFGCRKSLISPRLSPKLPNFLGRILIRKHS
jgi:hypothetical protein